MSERIRVLVCDDHAIVREGLRAVLTADEFTVVGEACDGRTVVEAVRRTRPDLVLMDVQMPGIDGISAAREILEEFPQVRVLALTTYGDEASVVESLRAGVHGYLLKDVDKLELKKHIHAVMRGEAVIDPKVAGLLVAKVRGGGASGESRPDPGLTPQQLTILRLVAQGYSNREIAAELGLSENTIKGHVAEVLSRMGARNRVEAAMQARARGWL